jgi:hypothetical protein
VPRSRKVLVSSEHRPQLLERACTHYLELYQEKGAPPKLSEVAHRLSETHPDEYPNAKAVEMALVGDDFHRMLMERRREYMVTSLAPRMFMAELGASVGREAAEEILSRLANKETRAKISNRDLIAMSKMAVELTEKVQENIKEVAEQAQVNKGTIVNLFTQLPPERATAIIQELIRRQIKAARAGEDVS